MSFLPFQRLALCALGLACGAASASEFMVSPVRADLRAGALSETINVANRGDRKIRVAVKVMEWTQDAQGKDVYTDTSDLVYFPRQMDVEPGAQRLVRVGAKAPGGATERTYRMFIEEQPDAAGDAGRAQVAVYFRFGVPIFLAPAVPRRQADVQEPTLDRGKVSVVVRNGGNQHVRITRLAVGDETGFSREVAGWYSLAGTERTYMLDVPRDVCRRAKTLSVAIEGDGVRADRKLHVDPARCG
ncbi:MAG TPA: fimbria/pilus periplasmic chaperone [Ramlibacter sp.]|jgi:fimbrial chaperone protein|nr:fimbria/pilus periplasmic chaperone [Ramlibacter sp.]